MPRIRTQAAKDSLLRRVRKQRLKYITVLPSLITILNGVCGFAAIVLAGKGPAGGLEVEPQTPLAVFQGHPTLALAAYMILLAMIADMLDGRVARMNKSTSSFGGQLDSLCDIVSFGVAPAFLMLKILEHKVAGFAEMRPPVASFLNRFIWLAAVAYVSCAAIRLARFNVENEEDESAHMSFLGLPTPAAAGVIVSLIIFHQETLVQLSGDNPRFFLMCDNVIIYSLPFLAFGMAALMVSRIRYPHVLNHYLKGKKPFAHLIWALLFLGLVIWTSRQAALVLIFCGFAFSGFAKWFYYKVLTTRLAGESQMSMSEVAE
ncbi:MAG: CDP-alcohol phosphatidyltransferase family protein [Planctomycetota bacterium]|jgi:CDP-diacylglycerol--serine O-phosphatidyltransferase